MFENRVLRRLFGPKSDEETVSGRKLSNEELHTVYASPDNIRMIESRRMKLAGHVARMGDTRNECEILDGNPEEKRSLGRHRRRLEDNIKMYLREIGC
jgi:hypothetical protein